MDILNFCEGTVEHLQILVHAPTRSFGNVVPTGESRRVARGHLLESQGISFSMLLECFKSVSSARRNDNADVDVCSQTTVSSENGKQLQHHMSSSRHNFRQPSTTASSAARTPEYRGCTSPSLANIKTYVELQR